MFRFLMLCVALLVLGGCSSSQQILKKPVKSPALSNEYLVGIGDQLSILVWKSPEFSVQVPVRPDGKITIPLIGDILAAGESANGLAKKVASNLSKYMRSPEVTVTVLGTSSTEYMSRVRVTGAVASPLSIQYRPGMTVLDLVLQAGGLTPYANGNKAKLFRKSGEKVEVYPVNLADILSKGDIESNYVLAPSDILTIPERAF